MLFAAAGRFLPVSRSRDRPDQLGIAMGWPSPEGAVRGKSGATSQAAPAFRADSKAMLLEFGMVSIPA